MILCFSDKGLSNTGKLHVGTHCSMSQQLRYVLRLSLLNGLVMVLWLDELGAGPVVVLASVR